MLLFTTAIKIVNGAFSWRYETTSKEDEEEAASSADRKSDSPAAVECLSDINLTLHKVCYNNRADIMTV